MASSAVGSHDFPFAPLLPLGEDTTPYRLVTTEGVSTFETPQGTFVNFPTGNHGVSNLPSRARPMIADWMADHLTAPRG